MTSEEIEIIAKLLPTPLKKQWSEEIITTLDNYRKDQTIEADELATILRRAERSNLIGKVSHNDCDNRSLYSIYLDASVAELLGDITDRL